MPDNNAANARSRGHTTPIELEVDVTRDPPKPDGIEGTASQAYDGNAASRGERHQKVVCSVSDCRDRLFFFMKMEDSKSETGKACKIFTTLQRNTLCQKSENMVWARDLFPHWRHDSDSAWLEICSVGSRWDLLHGRKVFCQSFGTTVTNFIIAEV